MADRIDADTRERLREHVRYLVNRFDGNRSALARKLGVRPQTIGKIVSGHTGVGFDLALRIHRRLHIELDKLVDDWPAGSRPTVPAGVMEPSRAGR